MNYQASTNNSSLMLHIRSEDSVSATPSHFKASIDPQSIDLKEQWLVHLSSAQIPYTFYQLNKNNNIIVITKENGVDVNITIDQGNYDIDSFLAIFQAKCKEVGIGITCHHNEPSNTIQYTSTQTLVIDKTKNTNCPWSHLGLRENISFTILSGSIPTVSNGVVNVHTINSIYLRCPSFAATNAIETRNRGFSHILAKIDIHVGMGEVIYYNSSMSKHSILSQQPTLTDLDIRLTDADNRLIDLNGQNYEISIQLDKINRYKEDLDKYMPHILRLIEQQKPPEEVAPAQAGITWSELGLQEANAQMDGLYINRLIGEVEPLIVPSVEQPFEEK